MAEHLLHGAIVLAYDRHTHDLVNLLVLRLRHRLGVTQYAHPYEVDPERAHAFIIVLSRADLAGVIKLYQSRHRPVPLLVHLEAPDARGRIDYDALYPGVPILCLAQDGLTQQPDETLSLTLFRDIMRRLDEVAGQT